MKATTILFQILLFLPGIAIGQNVGVGTAAPVEKLHVEGNIKADTIKPNAIKLLPNAGAGKLLTSDIDGNASWQTAVAAGNIGFGVWGDCATNANISEYQPVVADQTNPVTNLGISVAISGNYAIAGAALDFVDGESRGVANIYQFDGSKWLFMQKLTDADGALVDNFGNSVSMFGNFAVVGAQFDDGPAGSNQGSVSIFQFDGSDWVLMDKVFDPAGSIEGHFGCSVAVSGNYLIVGANAELGSMSAEAGSASIYQFDGTSWVFMERIIATSPTVGAGFGASVAISGNYAVAGEIKGNGGRGDAYIFEFDGSNWVYRQRIFDVNGSNGDQFGQAVSISGNTVAVGAPLDDGPFGVDQGSVHVFEYVDSVWVLMQKLTDGKGGGNDYFGTGISITDNYIVVGAYGDDGVSGIDQGAATIYQRIGHNWQRYQYLADPAANASDYFGRAVAFDEPTKRVLIGANGFVTFKGKIVFGKIK